MRHLISFAGALFLGSVAGATMDLQFVKRWNISTPLTCEFSQVVRNPVGGYVGLGKIANLDLAIMSFDASGNVLASKRWDSPMRDTEDVSAISVDSEGSIYLLAPGSTSWQSPQLYLTKFDRNTLATIWERKLTPTSGLYSDYKMVTTGTGGSEVVMLGAATTQSSVSVYRISKAGVVQGVTNIAHSGEVKAALPAPAAIQGGMILGGSQGSKPWICHVNGSGSILVDHQVAMDNARVMDISLTSANQIVAVGGPYAGFLTAWRQNANGTFTQTSHATFRPSGGFARISPSTFLVSAYETGAEKMVVYNAANATFGAVANNAASSGEVVANEGMGIYSVNGGNAHGQTNPLTDASTYQQSGLRSSAAVGADLVSVGSGGRLYSLRWGSISTGLTTVGYTPRNVADALPDGQGGVFQLIYGNTCHVQRLNSAGSILWTRALTTTGLVGTGFSKLRFYSNGDLAVGGRAQGGLMLARVTPTGTATFVKRILLDSSNITSPTDMHVDDQNRVWFMGASYQPDTSYKSILVRVDALGNNPAEVLGSSGSAGFRRSGKLLNGELAVLDGHEPTKLVRMNSDGQVMNSADVSIGSAAHLDTEPGTGRIATVGLVAGGLEVTVRNADFTPTLQTVIPNVQDGRVEFAPNGEIRVAYQMIGSVRIRSYTESGAMAWDQALPASVLSFTDLDVDPATGWAYVLGFEGNQIEQNVNVVRYLANGVRSAQRKTAGSSYLGLLNGGSYWAFGQVTTRGKSMEAFAAKWSLP